MYFYYPTKDDNHVAELTRIEIERHFRTSCELIYRLRIWVLCYRLLYVVFGGLYY
jgi:hypothetical protein